MATWCVGVSASTRPRTRLCGKLSPTGGLLWRELVFGFVVFVGVGFAGFALVAGVFLAACSVGSCELLGLGGAVVFLWGAGGGGWGYVAVAVEGGAGWGAEDEGLWGGGCAARLSSRARRRLKRFGRARRAEGAGVCVVKV